jgi:hypothetical protein
MLKVVLEKNHNFMEMEQVSGREMGKLAIGKKNLILLFPPPKLNKL